MLLCLGYDNLGFKLTIMIEVCDGCARSNVKSGVDRKTTYKRAPNPGEMNFLKTTVPFPENFIGYSYWTGVVYNYSLYPYSFLMKTKSQLLKKTKNGF